MAKKKTTTKPKTRRKQAAASLPRKRTKDETRSCSICGAKTMRYELRKDRLVYKGHTKEIDTLAWWCDTCDEGVIEGEALLARERAYFELRADVDGVLKPAEVTRIRGRTRRR
jgi:YgiT-type zinc finger domain-containing protein